MGPSRPHPLPALRPPFPSQDTVSVHRPSFYAERFFKFMSNTVFRKNSCECPGPLGRGAGGEGWEVKSRVNPGSWSSAHQP